MPLVARPLDPDSFARFGAVLQAGDGAVRTIRDGTVRLSRPDVALVHAEAAARPAVEIYECAPADHPLVAARIECHPHSMQLFAPMQAARWLVVVLPGGPGSQPEAFVAGAAQAILYHPGIWHHGIVALDRPAQFLSWMWRTDGPDDTVFADLPAPLRIGWPAPDAG